MHWNELLKHIAPLSRGGQGDPDIAEVTGDSRRAAAGSLYVSIPGLRLHGDAYIADALARGASAIVSERPQPACPAPWAQVENARKLLGTLSMLVWNIDTSQILLVGITGTNGKTTTAYLFHKLLDMVFGEHATWMFGTVRYSLGDRDEAAPRTTPESSDIFRAIAHAQRTPKAIVMEVSSHALALDRIAGLSYDCALWTNLTQDHLDFHNTMDDYYIAKKRLFTDHLGRRGRAVINIDDPWGRRLSGELGERAVVTYGKSEKADVRIAGWKSSWEGTEIDVSFGNAEAHFASKLPGAFNVYNMAALVAGARALSIDVNTIQRCFGALQRVPGRLERVPLEADFSVFVDYAHTPDALENVLAAARQLTEGRLVCVFGCGGDRDKTKRPLMAQAAAHNCDEAIITSDNPRGERPEAIIEDILQGMPLDFPHAAIVDRKEAIAKALEGLGAGDCLVVAGKGHEDYQEIKGERRHFDDGETIIELFAKARGR